MLRRYSNGIVSGAPISLGGVSYARDVVINSTQFQETHRTFLTGGSAGAVVTIKLTFLNRSTGIGSIYVNEFGGFMNVGDSFDYTLSPSGEGVFVVIIDSSDVGGANTVTAVLSITATSGSIGNPSTQSYSHTTLR